MKLFSSFTVFITISALVGCSGEPAEVDFQKQISTAYNKINLSIKDLTFPKLGIPYSTPGRLTAVDRAMSSPIWMITASNEISELAVPQNINDFTQLYSTLRLLDFPVKTSVSDGFRNKPLINISNKLLTNINRITDQSSRNLVLDITNIAQDYMNHRKYNPNSVTPEFQEKLDKLVSSHIPKREIRWFEDSEYFDIGKHYDSNIEAAYLLQFIDAISRYIDSLDIDSISPITFDTKFGKIRISGNSDDTHIGHFFLLIDTGGDDTYINLGTTSPFTGFTFVIDHAGNDRIEWTDSTGPGTGIFGISAWVDLQGNDIYKGSNAGAGTGIFGAGLLLDNSGSDQYISGSMTQAAGFFGVGILYDRGIGDDEFRADFMSQGYAGTGGLGLLINTHGDDSYKCQGKLPDLARDRVLRHREPHFISMCQGFSFGNRPSASGGIGILIDNLGNDHYVSDIFGQGSAYWFGLGMLIDVNGNDKYKAFEHAQGESLHLAAGLLHDISGDDSYTAFEHSQGTGIDRSIGILVDQQGNDKYTAVKESQGAGIKPFGAGILIDSVGRDLYSAKSFSQGYAKPLNKKFPAFQMPVGILLDLEGIDEFLMPGSKPVNARGRIQNERGIAINYQ